MIFAPTNEVQNKITQIVVLQNISWQIYKSLLAINSAIKKATKKGQNR
jgi:hypothetical protein